VIAPALVMAVLAQGPYIGPAATQRGSTEFGAAAVWTGGYDAGDAAALETRNTTTGTGPLTLFNARGTVSSATGVAGRVGLFVASRVSLEGAFQYTRPVLRALLSDDFESAAPVDADETISSYLFAGSLLYHFGSGRFMPFVLGGGGYLRQLHDGSAELVTGPEMHGGAGFKFWFGDGGRRFGLRVDAVASSRSKSAGFEEKRRVVPSVTGGICYLF
jgi:hypothetical protein